MNGKLYYQEPTKFNNLQKSFIFTIIQLNSQFKPSEGFSGQFEFDRIGRKSNSLEHTKFLLGLLNRINVIYFIKLKINITNKPFPN